MHPVDSLTGRVDINASKNGVTIFKSYNQSLAGDYSWSASWDSNSKFCSGTVHVSGQKSNVNIKVYSDCRDAGSNEF